MKRPFLTMKWDDAVEFSLGGACLSPFYPYNADGSDNLDYVHFLSELDISNPRSLYNWVASYIGVPSTRFINDID